jgi:hypothetical protein
MSGGDRTECSTEVLACQLHVHACGHVLACQALNAATSQRPGPSGVSYTILQAKPSTHCMCVHDHLFHTHEHKVFTDSQISRIKYFYYTNNVFKD